MDVGIFKEFEVFAKHLNYTHAAKELCMSQTNLSKHLKQLEQELEVTLVEKKGRRLVLTPAGSFFLDKAITIQREIESIKVQSKEISETASLSIVAEAAPFNDIARASYYSLLASIQNSRTGTNIKFKPADRDYPYDSLQSGDRDVLLDYNGFSEERAFKNFEDRGLSAYYLTTVGIDILIHSSSFYADKEHISLEDLGNMPLAHPCGLHSFVQGPVSALLSRYGIKPNLQIVNAHGKEEFLFKFNPSLIYAYPQGLENNPMLRDSDSIIKRIDDPRAIIRVFAVVRKNSPLDERISQLFSYYHFSEDAARNGSNRDWCELRDLEKH